MQYKIVIHLEHRIWKRPKLAGVWVCSVVKCLVYSRIFKHNILHHGSGYGLCTLENSNKKFYIMVRGTGMACVLSKTQTQKNTSYVGVQTCSMNEMHDSTCCSRSSPRLSNTATRLYVMDRSLSKKFGTPFVGSILHIEMLVVNVVWGGSGYIAHDSLVPIAYMPSTY